MSAVPEEPGGLYGDHISGHKLAPLKTTSAPEIELKNLRFEPEDPIGNYHEKDAQDRARLEAANTLEEETWLLKEDSNAHEVGKSASDGEGGGSFPKRLLSHRLRFHLARSCAILTTSSKMRR